MSLMRNISRCSCNYQLSLLSKKHWWGVELLSLKWRYLCSPVVSSHAIKCKFLANQQNQRHMEVDQGKCRKYVCMNSIKQTHWSGSLWQMRLGWDHSWGNAYPPNSVPRPAKTSQVSRSSIIDGRSPGRSNDPRFHSINILYADLKLIQPNL